MAMVLVIHYFLSPVVKNKRGQSQDSTDCDDTDPSKNPNTIETCDGEDNDCDGLIDEGVTQLFFADHDGDGFGIVSEYINACSESSGYVQNADDCDDNNQDTNPDTAGRG